MTRPWSRGEWVCFALASLAYLATTLFVLRNVLPDPSNLLPYNSGIDPANRQMGHFDQSMVVSVITRNADLLLTEPWNLLGDGQCYPFPRSFTLGEHMFGEGLLMAVPWLATRDPILSYNLMLVLTLWLPGVTMYLLAHHFTRHGGAAFIAGSFLLLSPPRIIDGGHPYLHAEFWLPLILLLLHRLFTTDRRWSSAAGIGLFLGLETLETIYVLIACGIVAGVYGLHLALRRPRRLAGVAVPLVAALLFAAGVAGWVLNPYFETRATWDVLAGRTTILFDIRNFGLGTPYFVGWLALALAVVALIDRGRGRRETGGDDPRLAMLAAALAILWASVTGIPIPGTDTSVPGLFLLLYDVVPGLDALRGLLAVSIGLWVPVALLAGFGVLVLLERLSRPAMIVVVGLLTLAVAAERFLPNVARWQFGVPLALEPWEARPPEDDIELIRKLPDGPVADVPMPPDSNALGRVALSRHLLLQSWNPQPSSSCYNSFDTPLAAQIFQLSKALPTPGAAEALAAVGFRTVLSHEEAWWPPHLLRWNTHVEQDPRVHQAMPLRYKSSGLAAYALRPQAPVHEDITRLGGEAQGPRVELRPREDDPTTIAVPFVFYNPGPETFRHPGPLMPRDGFVRWHRDGNDVGEAEPVRLLWPVALGAQGLLRVDVAARTPAEPGPYEVTLASAADPSHVLATREVVVLP